MSLFGYVCDWCHRYHRVSEAMHACRVEHRGSTGDKRWQFVTTGYHPKLPAGLRVSSKRQWDRLLRAHDLTDDIGIPERLNRLRSDVRGKGVRERRAAFREQLGKVMRQGYDAQRHLVLSGR